MCSGERGWDLLEELGVRLDRDELIADLAGFAAIAGGDGALRQLREACRGPVDPSRAAHREALLRFLRSWGCRHLRRIDTARSSRALAAWWARCGRDLPPVAARLTELDEEQIDSLGRAYEALARRTAAGRASPSGEVGVTFGDTAAAKALFAIRPDAVPPWDEPMRRAFGWRRAEAEDFARYLSAVQDALFALAARLETSVETLPTALGRPDSSAVKVVDEYLWMRITRAGSDR